jgi:STE24 endopeptidase
MTATWLTFVMVMLIWGDYLLERILEQLNAKRWFLPIPETLKDLYDEASYEKARQYSEEKRLLSRMSTIISTALIIGALLYGLPGKLQTEIAIYTNHPIMQALVFFGVVGIIGFIIGLPFSVYSTFVIEEKYGFNKLTPKLFVSDSIKGILLSSIIGGALLSAIILFFIWQPTWFWLYAWILFTAFSMFMAMFYTSWIVPMFNQLKPLEDDSLRDKLMSLADKAGFELKNVFVIDGSKRSTKANAYFSGFGHKKSIVLFDTLIEQLTEDEVVAVMAHEIGHYKKKHVAQGLVIGTLQTGLMLFLLSLCIQLPAFHEALGSQVAAFHLGLIAFSLLYSPVGTISGIAMNMLSRKNEYEADAFAAQYCPADDLISGLKKLHRDTLSNINPHPAFVFIHYSHPTLLQRIEHLDK